MWSLSPPIVFGIDDNVLPSAAVDSDARSGLSSCRLCEKGSSRGKDVGVAGSCGCATPMNSRAVKDSGGTTEQGGADVEVTDSLSSLLMAKTQCQAVGFRWTTDLRCRGASPVIEFCILHQHQLAAKTAKIERRHF